MSRTIAVILALLAAWISFGLTMYAWIFQLDEHCEQFVRGGLYGECVAPVGPLALLLSAVFLVATGALAFLALRKPADRS